MDLDKRLNITSVMRILTGYGPLALLEHVLDSLDDAWVRLADLLHLVVKVQHI